MMGFAISSNRAIQFWKEMETSRNHNKLAMETLKGKSSHALVYNDREKFHYRMLIWEL